MLDAIGTMSLSPNHLTRACPMARSNRSVGAPKEGDSTAVVRNLRIRSEQRARSGALRIGFWRFGRIGPNRSIERSRHRIPGG